MNKLVINNLPKSFKINGKLFCVSTIYVADENNGEILSATFKDNDNNFYFCIKDINTVSNYYIRKCRFKDISALEKGTINIRNSVLLDKTVIYLEYDGKRNSVLVDEIDTKELKEDKKNAINAVWNMAFPKGAGEYVMWL